METIKVKLLVSDFRYGGHIIKDIVTLMLLNGEDSERFYAPFRKSVEEREALRRKECEDMGIEYTPDIFLTDYTFGNLIRRYQTENETAEDILEEAEVSIGGLNSYFRDNGFDVQLELVRTDDMMTYKDICIESMEFISSTVITIWKRFCAEILRELLGTNDEGKEDYLLIDDVEHLTAIIPYKLVPFVDVVEKLVPAMVEKWEEEWGDND